MTIKLNKPRLFYFSIFAAMALFTLLVLFTFNRKTQLVFLCKSDKPARVSLSISDSGQRAHDIKPFEFELHEKTYRTIMVDIPPIRSEMSSIVMRPVSDTNNSYSIDYILLKKHGFKPVSIVLKSIEPLRDITILGISNVLLFKSTGDNAELSFALPTHKAQVDWLLLLFYVVISAFFALLIYFCSRFPFFKSNVTVTVMLILGILVILPASVHMALHSRFSASPDERDHFMAAEYFKTNSLTPQRNTNEGVHTYNALWAYSRVYHKGINYWLAGKFSNLFDRSFDSYLSVRFFGVMLLLVMLLLALRFPKQNTILLPVLMTPQVWYVFSYVNDDYFPLFLSFVLLFITEAFKNRLTEGILNRRTWLSIIITGLLLGFLGLSKRNYYVFLPFYLVYLYTLPVLFTGDVKGDLKKFLITLRNYIKIPLLITGIALLVIVGRQFTLGEPKGALREEVATYYKQVQANRVAFLAKGLSGKARFGSYSTMMKPWIKESYISFNGVYGYLTYFGSKPFYAFLLVLHVALILVFIWASIIRRDGTVAFWSLFFLASLLVTVFASSYLFSYNYGYQAQGRYLFPALPFLGLLLYKIESGIPKKIILSLVVMMFLAGIYSFVFVGCRSLCG